MKTTEPVKFDMYEMEYRGGAVDSDFPLIPFDEKFYEQYVKLIDDCYFEMRKARNIRPYEKHSYSLDGPLKLCENTFLYLVDGEIICAVSCFGNEIGTVAVNIKYQRQGYGRRLVRFAIDRMQKRGVSPIKLTVTKLNRNAISLYESLGFVIT